MFYHVSEQIQGFQGDRYDETSAPFLLLKPWVLTADIFNEYGLFWRISTHFALQISQR